MGRKFENEAKLPLFGKYADPFAERRGNGSKRPPHALAVTDAAFKRQFEPDKCSFCWLGHSSSFLHLQQQSILIDPVFSRFVSPVPFAGPRRFPGRAPRAEDFPEIDLVLITHSHYDHLDRKTIRALDRQTKCYVVPLGVGAVLKRFGVSPDKIRELNWYESLSMSGLEITLVPSQHDSGRGPLSMNSTLWGGYLLRGKKYTVYHSGDGGYADHFRKIQKTYGDVDLAIIECGQYNEKWHTVHMFPEESVQACVDLHAKLAVPVHWGAYVLSDHAWNDPPRRFVQRAKELGVPYRVLGINRWLIL